jgi:hypothetical protein
MDAGAKGELVAVFREVGAFFLRPGAACPADGRLPRRMPTADG